MTFAYAVPGWPTLVAIIGLCIGFACGGHVWVHRSFAKADFIEHNEVAGFVIAVVGVLYAVLIAFLTVVVWEHFDEAESRARSEADAATDIWRFGAFLRPGEAIRIRADVDRYAIVVADEEWPLMRHGKSSPEAARLVVALFHDVAAIPIDSRQRSNLQDHLFDRVQLLADLRRDRVNDNASGVPAVVYLGLVLGALDVIGFLYLFGLKNFRVQLLITAATAGMIGIVLALIVLLDYPFRGDVTVSNERWLQLHEMIVQQR